jgi:ATP-dependent DNA ligase
VPGDTARHGADELVVLDDQGRAQFEPLRHRALMRNPKSIVAASRETPGRRVRLRPHRIARPGSSKLSAHRYVQHIGENGMRLFQAAAELGVEGVVAKRADSPYRRGRTSDWVKIKTPYLT